MNVKINGVAYLDGLNLYIDLSKKFKEWNNTHYHNAMAEFFGKRWAKTNNEDWTEDELNKAALILGPH